MERDYLYQVICAMRHKTEILNLLAEGKNLREIAQALNVDPSVVSKSVSELKELKLVAVNPKEQRQEGESRYEVAAHIFGQALTLCIHIWGMVHYDEHCDFDDATTVCGYICPNTALQFMEDRLRVVNNKAMRYTMRAALNGKTSTQIQEDISETFGIGQSTVRLYLKECIDLGLIEPTKNGKGKKYKACGEIWEYLIHPRVPDPERHYIGSKKKKFTAQDMARNMEAFNNRKKA